MANARSRFKQLLRSAEADLAFLTRAACTLHAGTPPEETFFSLPDLQQQQQRSRGLRGSAGAAAAAAGAATPCNDDSPRSGSTADSAGGGSSSSSSSSSIDQLLEVRVRVASTLNAAEKILAALRTQPGVYGASGAAAAAADKAQARHFSDLLLAAREELSTVSASLDASIERQRLLGDRPAQRKREREGVSLLQQTEETDEAALGKERTGLLHANSSIQQMIDSGFAALQQLRGQRHRQQQQMLLVRVLGSGASGVRTLITSVYRVRRRDKIVLGLVLGCCLVFTFLWLSRTKANT